MSNRRAFWLLLAWVLICVSAVYATYQLYYGGRAATYAPVTPPTRAPTFTPDIPGTETTIAERTAIAIFTQNPTLALSSTPFFAEIIYNETIRLITATPGYWNSERLAAFQRMTVTSEALMTTSPTPAPPLVLTSYLTTTPTLNYHCEPAIGLHDLGDFVEHMVYTLYEVNLETSVYAATRDIHGIDQACIIPPQPVVTVIVVSIDVETISYLPRLSEMTAHVLQAILDNQVYLDYVSTRQARVTINFRTPNETIYITADYFVALQAYNDGLRGDALVEALGGFVFP
ncbi:MAG: hypothetical protein U0694_03450 [Anaerolineae bacterium]